MTLNDTKYQKNIDHFDKISSHDNTLNHIYVHDKIHTAAAPAAAPAADPCIHIFYYEPHLLFGSEEYSSELILPMR